MVFKPNIPAASDKLRVSQGEIQENFNKLNSIFDIDHVTYDDVTGDGGKHEATTFVNRTDKVLTIPPTTTAQELAFYVKDDAANIPQIFYQEPDSAGAGAEVQVSGNVINGANGEAPLMGSSGIKWMQLSLTHQVSQNITYAGEGLTAFDTNTYSIFSQIDNGTGNIGISSLTKDGFSIVGTFDTVGTYTVYVGVIGS